MSAYQINIDMDKKCSRCGKGGATDGGLCMTCVVKAMKKGEFDGLIKKDRHIFENMEAIHKTSPGKDRE